jgi:sortase B
MLKVNFDNLLRVNDETVGWLYVPGTKINYPVTQTDNNDFYLTHTFDKSSNSVGWVFLDYRNNGLLTDRNNVIYAHGRLDNIMFGTLKNVIKKSWYTNESNRIIKTATPTHSDLWEVFSVYTIKSESYYISTGFENNLDYYNFIQTITDRSIYDFDVTVSTTDKILTLSTCLNDYDERIVLHARLVLTDGEQDDTTETTDGVDNSTTNNETTDDTSIDTNNQDDYENISTNDNEIENTSATLVE